MSISMPRLPDLSGRALDGRYELQAMIGEGTFGRVYRARDRRLERLVAVKLIKPWWAEDPEWVRRFERETRLLARLSHPGIVQIHDVGHAPEGLFYVAELVEGRSLAMLLRGGPVPAQRARRVAEQLCRALGGAHRQGIVHRDVKPANILLPVAGPVKVGDFGLARTSEGSSDGGSAVVGTPRYMAPEQARGRAVTPAGDVYSAGIVLYEMLAGHAPFSDGSPVEVAMRHLAEAPAPLPAHVPPGLAGVVERALAKQPAERYRDGAEMAAALAAASLDSAPRPARARGLPATLPAPPRSPRRNLNPAARRRSAALIGLALLVLAGMVAAAALTSGPSPVTVPGVLGLGRSAAARRLRHVALRAAPVARYSSKPEGTVVSEAPAAGTRVAPGSRVQLAVSAGPPPVPVPDLAGEPAGTARARLARSGLRASIKEVQAPGVPAWTVTSQVPAPGVGLAPGRTVSLQVAEVPRWRPITGLGGGSAPQTVEFRVLGPRWRMVYTMAYQGTCTFVVFCMAPTATITPLSGQGSPTGFDLSDGGRQVRSSTLGPGLYRLRVSPGGDSSRWSVWIQDYY